MKRAFWVAVGVACLAWAYSLFQQEGGRLEDLQAFFGSKWHENQKKCEAAFLGGLGAGAVLLGLSAGPARTGRGMRQRGRDLLERVLFTWSPDGSVLRTRDVLNHICVLGRTGSGKTSSSGRALGRAALSIPGSGGIILCPKPGDRRMWIEDFTKTGRLKDLVIWAPDQPVRFNFLEYVARHGNDTQEITKVITTIGETLLRGESGRDGDDGRFWQMQQERTIQNAVEVVKLAMGGVTAWDLHTFVAGMAQSPEQVLNPQWQQGFHFQTLEQAHRVRKTPREEHDFNLARLYFLNEMPATNERTRTSITCGVFQVLDCFNRGIVREMVSGATTHNLDDVLQGKWWLVDFGRGEAATFICAGVKYLLERAVLQRHWDGKHVVVVFCDESPQYVNSHDALYASQARSHGGGLIFLAQGLPSFYSALKGETGKHQTESLLGQFSHVVCHATDPITAEWAARKIGRERQTFFSGSVAPAESPWDELMGRSRFTASFSQNMEHIVEPREFMSGLRTGGPENGFVCEAIVIRSGEPFRDGRNYKPVAFSQKG